LIAILPPLDDLDLDINRQRGLRGMAGMAEPGHEPGRRLADGYVTRVCRSILRYEDARACVAKFKRSQTSRNFFELQAALEGSVHDLHRAMGYLERLRASDPRDERGTSLVPRHKHLSSLSSSAVDRIRRFRDAIEHLDRDMVAGRFPSGWLVGVAVEHDAMRIHQESITYSELADWLRDAFAIAARLSEIPGMGSRRNDAEVRAPGV
jgi:hypothetical protein